jgi:hypothetical protein
MFGFFASQFPGCHLHVMPRSQMLLRKGQLTQTNFVAGIGHENASKRIICRQFQEVDFVKPKHKNYRRLFSLCNHFDVKFVQKL